MADDVLSPGQGYIYMEKRFLAVPVRRNVLWSDLQHVAPQQEALERNMRALLHGGGHHHVLLWGARGTGKSSLLRALFWRHADRCALVQILPPQMHELPWLLWRLSQEALPVLLYLDDVSFQEDDAAFRHLKSLLDGAIFGIPERVMLLASSNRRHLLPRRVAGEALHPEEEREEHLSLVERFGLRLAFHSWTQEQYLSCIAHTLGELDADGQRQALQFALRQGSRSGRVAAQFMRQWAQREALAADGEHS